MATRTTYQLNAAAPFMATGLVHNPEAFLTPEARQALGDGTRPRATVSTDDPRPVVAIECSRIVEEYGRRKTEVFEVRVPDSPEAHAVQMGPISFVGLTVTVSINDGGKRPQLRESFAAESIATPGKRGE